jgi:hypothetical protein
LKQVRPRRVPTPVEQTDANKQKDEQAAVKTSGDAKTCTVSVSEEEVSIINNGGRVAVTVMLDGIDEKKISVDFDWSNLSVFLEPNARTDGRSALYTITSSSKNTGIYKITFKTPCGSKEVTVKVR